MSWAEDMGAMWVRPLPPSLLPRSLTVLGMPGGHRILADAQCMGVQQDSEPEFGKSVTSRTG